MTIKELITKLQEYPQDQIVGYWDCEYSCVEVDFIIKETTIVSDTKREYIKTYDEGKETENIVTLI